jgi:hypothetical protein
MRMTRHARERMRERGIDRGEVRRCLRWGVVYRGRCGALVYVWQERTVVVSGKKIITVV